MMSLCQRFIKYFTHRKCPKHLFFNGRKKLKTSSFQDQDKLYRSYDSEDLDENYKILLEAISFTDLSCNWCRFSEPEDVLFRKNVKKTDGGYSFTVEASRYENMATPVHDPDPGDNKTCPNYAHVEVRALRKGETVLSEPPKKNRKLRPDAKKMAYRQNLRKCLKIEFMAT